MLSCVSWAVAQISCQLRRGFHPTQRVQRTQRTQWTLLTRRPWRKDRSAVVASLAVVALRALRALRRVETPTWRRRWWCVLRRLRALRRAWNSNGLCSMMRDWQWLAQCCRLPAGRSRQVPVWRQSVGATRPQSSRCRRHRQEMRQSFNLLLNVCWLRPTYVLFRQPKLTVLPILLCIDVKVLDNAKVVLETETMLLIGIS